MLTEVIGFFIILAAALSVLKKKICTQQRQDVGMDKFLPLIQVLKRVFLLLGISSHVKYHCSLGNL